MVAALVLLLLLAVLFGGLGVLVAPAFFVALIVALVLRALSGGVYVRRGSGRRWRAY